MRMKKNLRENPVANIVIMYKNLNKLEDKIFKSVRALMRDIDNTGYVQEIDNIKESLDYELVKALGLEKISVFEREEIMADVNSVLEEDEKSSVEEICSCIEEIVKRNLKALSDNEE